MAFIVDIARAINRRTHRLDWLKERLGITKFAATRLVRELSTDEVAQIRSQLDTTSLLKNANGKSHFVIVLIDKMGDVLACVCVARYLKEHFPGARVTWFVKSAYRDLLERNPNIDNIMTVSCLSEAMDAAKEMVAKDPLAIFVNLHFDGAACPKTGRCFRNLNNPVVNTSTYFALGSLSESFSLAAGLPMVSGSPELYVPDDLKLDIRLPERYIVCHTMSDDPARNWQPDRWNAVVDKLRARGLAVVEIGGYKVLEHADVDFSGMRRLVDIAYIIKHAVGFVGVDSGFAHFANALEIPSVIIIGAFRNFPIYSPYAGDFSKSGSFMLCRAPTGRPAAEVTAESVFESVEKCVEKGKC